jgi:hypothetical protein
LPVELGINVSSLPRDHSRRFGRVQYALPDFKLINDSAYWHYQRTEIYGRSDASLRKLLIKSESKQKPPTPLTSSVATEPTSRCCPKCSEPTLYRHRTRTKTVFDLTFSKTGVRRRAAKLSFVEYRCHKCGCCPPAATRKERYGRGLRSYVVYALLQLRLSLRMICDNVGTLFNIWLGRGTIVAIRGGSAKEYSLAYDSILARLVGGPLVHADETQIKINGATSYV